MRERFCKHCGNYYPTEVFPLRKSKCIYCIERKQVVEPKPLSEPHPHCVAHNPILVSKRRAREAMLDLASIDAEFDL